ncbi:hypothetical protein Bca4012_009413 [Brassica carinata]
MGLHNFIKISNYSDENFANTMLAIGQNNRDSESDFVDTEKLDVAQGKHMAQIRNNIANMLWENQNS